MYSHVLNPIYRNELSVRWYEDAIVVAQLIC